MEYDPNNIFARICAARFLQEGLRGQPCAGLPRHQPAGSPACPDHPPGAYISWADFAARGSTEEITAWCAPSARWHAQLGLEEKRYRTLANHGGDAHQEVPHFPHPSVRRPAAWPHDPAARALIAVGGFAAITHT